MKYEIWKDGIEYDKVYVDGIEQECISSREGNHYYYNEYGYRIEDTDTIWHKSDYRDEENFLDRNYGYYLSDGDSGHSIFLDSYHRNFYIKNGKNGKVVYCEENDFYPYTLGFNNHVIGFSNLERKIKILELENFTISYYNYDDIIELYDLSTRQFVPINYNLIYDILHYGNYCTSYFPNNSIFLQLSDTSDSIYASYLSVFTYDEINNKIKIEYKKMEKMLSSSHWLNNLYDRYMHIENNLIFDKITYNFINIPYPSEKTSSDLPTDVKNRIERYPDHDFEARIGVKIIYNNKVYGEIDYYVAKNTTQQSSTPGLYFYYLFIYDISSGTLSMNLFKTANCCIGLRVDHDAGVVKSTKLLSSKRNFYLDFVQQNLSGKFIFTFYITEGVYQEYRWEGWTSYYTEYYNFYTDHSTISEDKGSYYLNSLDDYLDFNNYIKFKDNQFTNALYDKHYIPFYCTPTIRKNPAYFMQNGYSDLMLEYNKMYSNLNVDINSEKEPIVSYNIYSDALNKIFKFRLNNWS